MIALEYIIDKDKTLLTILFNQQVSDHLDVKCNDYLILFQSHHNINHFTLFKSDTGYRIKRYPYQKKIYKIEVSHKLLELPEFELKECSYFMRKNNSIIIKL